MSKNRRCNDWDWFHRYLMGSNQSKNHNRSFCWLPKCFQYSNTSLHHIGRVGFLDKCHLRSIELHCRICNVTGWCQSYPMGSTNFLICMGKTLGCCQSCLLGSNLYLIGMGNDGWFSSFNLIRHDHHIHRSRISLHNRSNCYCLNGFVQYSSIFLDRIHINRFHQNLDLGSTIYLDHRIHRNLDLYQSHPMGSKQ